MLLKNRNISSKIKRSKVTDYAALRPLFCLFLVAALDRFYCPGGVYVVDLHKLIECWVIFHAFVVLC